MSLETVAILRALVRAIRPWLLLAGLLFYTIGGGVAVFLGEQIDWPVFWLGAAAVTMLQLSGFLLSEYFNRTSQPPFEQVARRRISKQMAKRPPTPQNMAEEEKPEEPVIEEVIVPRVIFLQAAAAALTIGAVMTVLLMAAGSLSPAGMVLLGIGFGLAIAYAVPPVHLAASGYGELVVAVMVANLFPALGYALQVGDLHRLLAMLTMPLTFLLLAGLLARSLQSYAEDVRRERQTMLVRVGWQRGMVLHNALIAMAYIALAVGVISGLSTRLAYPAFLSLPVGVFQIYQMQSIAGGAKPRWGLLGATALATIGLAVYFLNFALWTG